MSPEPPNGDFADHDDDDDADEELAYEVITYPADYTLDGLDSMIEEEDIYLPPFQRGYVWTQPRASKLIESFLLGLPVPGVFLYKEPDTQQYLVVDGQQRLWTIHYFFKGLFPNDRRFRLKGVQEKWEGKSYDELDAPDQRRLRNSVLRASIINQLAPEGNAAIYQIFQRLNTTTDPLRPQEIRNCVARGPFNDLLVELNEYPTWRAIFGSDDPHKRLADVELILRVITLAYCSADYRKPMKRFLNDFMEAHRRPSKEFLDEVESSFKLTCDLVADRLGDKPFHVQKGLNRAALESVMVAILENDAGASGDLQEKFDALLEEPTYLRAITRATTDEDAVRDRLELARAMVRD